MDLSEIEYGSLLSYTPRPISDSQKHAQTIMIKLKTDAVLSSQMTMSEYVADQISKNLDALPFADLFKVNPILIPTPKSSFSKPGTLWVPQRLTAALVSKSLGKEAISCLSRVTPVEKSAGNSPANRPPAEVHRDSMDVTIMLDKPKEILLVDDVVTRGATLLGAANKLAEAFPDARIRAFAVICTRTRHKDFLKINDPYKGLIYHTINGTFREQKEIFLNFNV